MATADSPLSLGSKSIGKLLVQYSVPAIIASVATSLYNIVDSIFIGRGVGPMAIAGLAITFPLMNLVVAFCTLIAVGGATISSIFIGQKNESRATDVVNNVMTLCLIHSIVFGGITLIFLDEILYFFGATPETISYAREFMRIILYGTPISYIFIGLNNLMRATGYPKKAMISALLSVLVNVILAPIFIFSFKWGIAGAAFATICGQFAAFVWVLHHFLSKKSFIHFQLSNRWFTPSIIRRIYSIGLSPFLMNVCACVVVIFINKALLDYAGTSGNLAVGAYGIINRTTMFFVMIVFGVTQGMQPILGFNYGARQYPRVREAYLLAIKWNLIVSAIGFFLLQCFPQNIISLFGDGDKLYLEFAVLFMRIYLFMVLVNGVQLLSSSFFTAIGKAAKGALLALTRQVFFLIPLILVLPLRFGILGVLFAGPLADFSAFILSIILVTQE